MVVTSSAVDRRLKALPVGTAVPLKLDGTVRSQPVGTATPVNLSNPPTAPAPAPMGSAIDATRPNYQNVDQFDFNRNYEDQLDQLMRQRADLEQQNDLDSQRMNEDYGRQFREVRRAQDEALGFDAERMASQGILRSGIAVKSAGDLGARYGGELDVLQRQLSGQLENRETAYAQAQRQIQEQIGRAQEASTRQQQQLEEQRARQLAAAQAAQQAAQTAAQEAATPKPQLILDSRGRYRVVDPSTNSYQTVDQADVGRAVSQFGAPVQGLVNTATALRNPELVPTTEAMIRRLTGRGPDNRTYIAPNTGYSVGGKWMG